MARQRIADGLQLYAELDPDQGYYFFGVNLSGADIDLYARKQGGIDADIAEAKAQAAEQAQDEPPPAEPSAEPTPVSPPAEPPAATPPAAE